MTTTHIMLDLETWGKTPGSDIRSIGACVFDPVAGNITQPLKSWRNNDSDSKLFYLATDNPAMLGLQPRKYPLTRDPQTVQWWNDQSAEAQAAFANPIDLSDALMRFIDWFHGTIKYDIDRISDVRLWANGPQFDVSILAAAYRACQLPEPWHYRAPRDFRTIVDAAGITREEMREFDHGTTHNALDDAISQAAIVCEAYKRLGLQR